MISHPQLTTAPAAAITLVASIFVSLISVTSSKSRAHCITLSEWFIHNYTYQDVTYRPWLLFINAIKISLTERLSSPSVVFVQLMLFGHGSIVSKTGSRLLHAEISGSMMRHIFVTFFIDMWNEIIEFLSVSVCWVLVTGGERHHTQPMTIRRSTMLQLEEYTENCSPPNHYRLHHSVPAAEDIDLVFGPYLDGANSASRINKQCERHCQVRHTPTTSKTRVDNFWSIALKATHMAA